ncbi:hypothetical protein [Variovorax sp. DXTD-1]|uniref:hypothetical protein n=1 Tax=Variovorax sp. DXTD-1 TaxID=2495592 RepID=UPI000F88DF2D|nr:hypothetical protein [Variovorax sp. DXTD-1]RST54110.1 hypothetical protein EJI00_03000 [Variovorax sp. DXTD-1]
MADNSAGQTRTPAQDPGTPGTAVGKIVFDATALTAADDLFIDCGFTPRYVRIRNTNGVTIEWYAGMAEASAFKQDATGAATLSAAVGIKTDPRGFRVAQNATLAAVAASNTLYYLAKV